MYVAQRLIKRGRDQSRRTQTKTVKQNDRSIDRLSACVDGCWPTDETINDPCQPIEDWKEPRCLLLRRAGRKIESQELWHVWWYVHNAEKKGGCISMNLPDCSFDIVLISDDAHALCPTYSHFFLHLLWQSDTPVEETFFRNSPLVPSRRNLFVHSFLYG